MSSTVQEADPGAHFEQISGLDFASLYPSIMIANNYSYETIVKGQKYDNIDNILYENFQLTFFCFRWCNEAIFIIF